MRLIYSARISTCGPCPFPFLIPLQQPSQHGLHLQRAGLVRVVRLPPNASIIQFPTQLPKRAAAFIVWRARIVWLTAVIAFMGRAPRTNSLLTPVYSLFVLLCVVYWLCFLVLGTVWTFVGGFYSPWTTTPHCYVRHARAHPHLYGGIPLPLFAVGLQHRRTRWTGFGWQLIGCVRSIPRGRRALPFSGVPLPVVR